MIERVDLFTSRGVEIQSVGYEKFIPWVISTGYRGKYVINNVIHIKQVDYILHLKFFQKANSKVFKICTHTYTHTYI